MKSKILQLTTAVVTLCTFAASVPHADAAEIRLDGYGYYSRSNYVRFYGNGGKKQSGRVTYLQSDYYRATEIGIDFLTNRSNSKSGSLSFEFWALPFYGATSGIVLMSLGTSPLGGGTSKKYFHGDGYAVSLDASKFPELNIWEYTRNGWKFRDALPFSRKARL